MFSTLLVPLDGSDLARRALPYAAALAKAARARLILLHAYIPGRDIPANAVAAADPELDTIMELSDLAGDLRRRASMRQHGSSTRTPAPRLSKPSRISVQI